MKAISSLLIAGLLLPLLGAQETVTARRRAASAPPAPPTGMLVWYRGDSLTCTVSCSGSNVVTALVDKSGNGNNATGSTAAIYSGGVIGGQPGVLFSNTSASIFTFGTPINLQGSPLTICTAQELTSTAAKSTLVSGGNGSFAYWFVDSGGREHGADSSFTAQIIAGTAAADTAFHSSCVTYDGSTTAALYLDNAPDGTATIASTPITANEVCIGANGCSMFAGETYNGTLLDLVIYNTVLPATGANSIATWFTYTSARY